MMKEHEAVKIFTTVDNLQAEMILASLKEHNISAYKKDLGNAGFLNMYTGNSRFGEEIYVADVNVEKARRVLEGIGLLPEEE